MSIFLFFLFTRISQEALSDRVSADKIREALRGVTVIEFSIDRIKFYLRSKMNRVEKQFLEH